MPRYLVELVYTSDAWSTQVRWPQHAIDRVRPAAEGLGGRILSAYYTFGEYDLVSFVEFPDHESAAAFTFAAQAAGHVEKFSMTRLMAMEEGVEAMSKAAAAGYTAPTRG